MIPEITQKNLYLLLPGKVSWLADMIIKDKHCSVNQAIKEIYSSSTYQQLENEETKLWHQGPVALYEQLLEEEK